MPKARKRKNPIVAVDTASSSSSTPLSSRTTIRRFHILLKRQAQLQNANLGDATNSKALAEVENQIVELGGLEQYQRMSAVGQGTDRGGGSEKVLIGWLKDMELHRNRSLKLRCVLLEIGALKPDNYHFCSAWIDPTPMDLRSRHPSILEQDFLALDIDEHREKWDVISLSLVLNFVPEPKDRGRMLRLAHSFLVPGGHLFLALPLPCVTNSRYLDFPNLKALMEAIGFTELQDRWKEGRKMAYWLYRRENASGRSLESFGKKSVLRQGNRNNFCVLVENLKQFLKPGILRSIPQPFPSFHEKQFEPAARFDVG
ncbi:nucleolus protein [Lyophyllum atratum]|nr:nucleolus protein [Lyophyllum atratum]